MPLRLLIAAILLSICENILGVGGAKIIGVPPNEQDLYNPIVNKETGEKTWHCLGDPRIVLNYDQINDNYCDCPDGSDEPGTNACPYDPVRKFYCHNEGNIPGYLENFKLNDGVCDYEICCDGSDEYLTGKCENKCSEIHQQYVTYLQVSKEEMDISLSEKKKLLSIAQEKRDNAKNRIETLNKELELSLRSKDKEIESQPQEDASDQSVYSKLSPYLKELQTNIQLERSKLEDHSKNIAFLENILSSLIENYNPNFNDLAVKETVNKFRDYVSNKDEQESSLQVSSINVLNSLAEESEKLSYNIQNENVDKSYPGINNMIHYYYTSFVNSLMESPKDDDLGDGKEEAVVNAETVDVESLKNEIAKIKEDLGKDYGKDDILRSVQSQWIKKRLGGYSYNIGFLDSIYQDSILIGRYSRIEGNKLIYDQGAKCWNGPRRSGTVEMICGPKNDLISIGEPEKCEYHLELMTPIACNEMLEEELLSNFKINYEKL